ncbi:hypothetical protein OY671_012278, partial [Metschnikowia pulcherrima]
GEQGQMEAGGARRHRHRPGDRSALGEGAFERRHLFASGQPAAGQHHGHQIVFRTADEGSGDCDGHGGFRTPNDGGRHNLCPWRHGAPGIPRHRPERRRSRRRRQRRRARSEPPAWHAGPLPGPSTRRDGPGTGYRPAAPSAPGG